MAKWYYNHDNKAFGPIDDTVIREWVKQKAILPDYLLRKEGVNEWQRASLFQELWEGTAATAPLPGGPLGTGPAVGALPPVLNADGQPQGTRGVADSAAQPRAKVKAVWEIKSADGTVATYEQEADVIRAVAAGQVHAAWACRSVELDDQGQRLTEPAWKIVRQSFAFFHPLRNHAWGGAAIGAVTGCLVWFVLNAAALARIALVAQAPKCLGMALANLFWVALILNSLAEALPPKHKRTCAFLGGGLMKLIIIGGGLAVLNGGMGVLSGIFSGLGGSFVALIIGALIGGLPGMAIGTTVGLFRRPFLPALPPSARESATCALLAGIALPLTLLATGTVLYIRYVLPLANAALIDFVTK